MKALYNLLALSCIVSTACSEKILGDFNGPIHGGTFNSEVQKTNMVANINNGQFTGGTFIGKRDQQQGINSSEVVDNKKKDKRQNIISGDMSGTFLGGSFNGKRDNKRQNIISGDMSGTFAGGSFNGKRDNKRQNIISGDMSGTFTGGSFNGKRDTKLPPILPDDFQGIITTDTLSVFTSNVPFTGQNVFPHSYTFVTPNGKKLNIRSKNELKTKEDRRNALVEVEKVRRSGLKKGEDAIDIASDKVEKLTHDLNEKFSKFVKF